MIAHPLLTINFFSPKNTVSRCHASKIVQVWSAHGTFFRDVTVYVTVEKESFAHPLYF